MQKKFRLYWLCSVLLMLSVSLISGTQLVQASVNKVPPGPPPYYFYVNSTVDAVDLNPGDGICATVAGCTLRAAIQEANAIPGADAIILPAGNYTLTIPGPLEDAGATGDLDITDDLKITGASAATTIVNANGLDRVFDIISENSHVEIENITLRNGRLVANHANGGGVYNRGQLLLRRSVVTENDYGDYAPSGGDGAIYNHSGTVQLEQSRVENNGKGGVVNYDQLIVTDSRLAQNQQTAITSRYQWGVYVIQRVTVNNSVIEQNDGGIASENGTLLVQTSQIINNRGFGISALAQTTISASTIMSNSGGVRNEGSLAIDTSIIGPNQGVGITGRGSVYIRDSAVLSNTNGGLILDSPYGGNGFATIDNTTIQGNQSTKTGGGIYNHTRLILDHVTVRANTARSGGGIFNDDQLLVKNSTISQNGATNGGGLYEQGDTLILDNSTVSGNTAVQGGGLFDEHASKLGVQLANVTVANNTAEQSGGGLYLAADTLHLQNSLLAANHSQTNQGNDCFTAQPLDSRGYNLIQDNTNCPIGGITTGNLIGVDPKLGPLQANAGKTWTHALLIDSPAIDSGNPNGCLNELGQSFLTDQRGDLRTVAVLNPQARCDMGAFEFGDRSPNTVYMPQIYASSSSAILAKPATTTQVAETSGMLSLGLMLGGALVASLGIIFLAEDEPEQAQPTSQAATKLDQQT